MPSLPEEKPATLMSWIQLFGFLLTVMLIAYVVVSAFAYLFGPSGGAK